MRNLTALAALCALAPLALAQDPGNANIGVATSSAGKVTITSKGRDVRDVLYDLFHQSKKNFVIVGEARANLYLNLEGVDFDQAFGIILRQVGLQSWVDGEITYIGKNRPAGASSASENSATRPETAKATKPGPDLDKKITVKLTKVTFKELLKEFTNQTGIDFVVAHDVKEFRLDADLTGKSLKYALDLITKQVGLQYYALESGAVLVEHKVN